jgi:hypothetical protein
VALDPTAMLCTRAAAARVVCEDMTIRLPSLAGHDSALIAMRVLTSMIFVPSKDGISHARLKNTRAKMNGKIYPLWSLSLRS